MHRNQGNQKNLRSKKIIYYIHNNKYFVKNCRLQKTRRSERVLPVPKTSLQATLQTLELQGGEGGQTLQEATLQDTTLLADSQLTLRIKIF